MNGLLEPRELPPLTTERYREIFDFPVRNYYVALGFDLDSEPFPVLAAEWVGAYAGHWRNGSLRAGALATIFSLDAAGVTQSVLSASEQRLLAEQAEHFGVSAHLSQFVGIDDHHAETKLEHGLRWMAETGIDPVRTVMVGDTVHDYEVGMELGVDVLLLTDGHQSAARLAGCGVPLAASLAEVEQFISGRPE
jgi:phosphoglycolate phosphatase